MATDSDARSVHRTLVANTADVVTLTATWDRIRVTNRSETDLPLWILAGTEANVGSISAAGKGTEFVPGGSWVEVDMPGDRTVQLIGEGTPYTVAGSSPSTT